VKYGSLKAALLAKQKAQHTQGKEENFACAAPFEKRSKALAA
jgi:hypothetical protein